MRCQRGSAPGHTAHDMGVANQRYVKSVADAAPTHSPRTPGEWFSEALSLATLLGIAAFVIGVVLTFFGIGY